jgi:selenide,water dikinase
VRLAGLGNLTGGCKRNRAYLTDKIAVDPKIREGLIEVAFDPQTSGGLLIAVDESDAAKLVARLQDNGIPSATVVGHAVPHRDVWVRLG